MRIRPQEGCRRHHHQAASGQPAFIVCRKQKAGQGRNDAEEQAGPRTRHAKPENQRDIDEQAHGQPIKPLGPAIEEEAGRPGGGQRDQAVKQPRIVVAIGKKADAVEDVGRRIIDRRGLSGPCTNWRIRAARWPRPSR